MENKKKYTTHWHSFWFGFMCSLAIVLFVLLIFTGTDRITFPHSTSKKVDVSAVTKNSDESTAKKTESLSEIAGTLDINVEEFDTCMAEERFTQAVQADIDSGRKAGVRGTPHSFVLFEGATYKIEGAQDASTIRGFFDDLLAGNDARETDISDKTDLETVTDEDWVVGDENARITMIIYSDIDCPFCQRFHTTTTNLMQEYPEDVRWVFRHMPIDGLHPHARQKAEAAECVGEIGGGVKFWEYLDIIFAQN
jgi:protein-disulfide isomerase